MLDIKFGKRKVVNYRGAKMVVGGLTAKNKIDILMYINKELASFQDEGKLIDKLIELLVDIYEADNITLRKWDGHDLFPVRTVIETTPPRRPVKEGEGYSGNVFKDKQSALISDLEKRPDLIDKDEEFRCVMCVPINTKDEVVGTLAVEKTIPHFYKEEDLQILESISAQLGLAMTNVQLIQGLIKAREAQQEIQSELEWDLKMGRNVQSQIVPDRVPSWNSINFKSFYEPMVEVSGDYFDVSRKKDATTILMVDVSGHGVPAALVTMAIHYHFQMCMSQGMGLMDTMSELSDATRGVLPEGVYYTAQILRIYADFSFSFINAGHHKLAHFKYETGEIVELDTPGLPIGFVNFERDNYQEIFSSMRPGDTLLMLTDGFTEQRNEKGKELGSEKIYQWVTECIQNPDNSAGKPLIDNFFYKVIDKFKKYIGDTKIEDDLTMLMVQLNPWYNKALSQYEKAMSLYSAGDIQTAKEIAESVTYYDDSMKENLVLLSKIYYSEKDFEKAAGYLKQYINLNDQNNSKDHYVLGSAYFKSNNIAAAKKQFKRALAMEVTFSSASIMLARCYLKEKSMEKALKTLKTALEVSPNNQLIKRALNKVQSASAVTN